MQTIHQFAAHRHLGAQQVVAGHRQLRDLVQGTIEIRLRECRPEPRPRRLTQQVLEFTPSDPIGVDPLQRSADQPRRLRLRHSPTVRLAQEFRLQGEVHGAAGHIQRQLLRLKVVFEEGHGERQRDAAAQPVTRGG